MLTALWPLVVSGQAAHFGIPQTINFSKEEYGGGTQNWCIVQDETGMMVYGNNKGVLLFDGTRWELLPMPNRTIVRSVAKTEDGRILVGGQDEFGWLVKDNNGTLHYQSLIDQLLPEDRSFEDVWKIFPTDDGIYFCTQKALFIYKNDQFTVIKAEERFVNFFYADQQLFTQELGKGLLRLEEGKFKLLPGGEQFSGSRIAAILPQQNELLIISDFSGLFHFNGTAIKPWQTEVSTFLRLNQAYCALQLPNENIAIGTAQNGLVVIDEKGEILLHLNKSSGLQNNTVLALCLDHLNNFWLALDNGIDYCQVSMPFFSVSDELGLEGTGYDAKLYEGSLYLATNQGLFYVDWPLKYRNQLLNKVNRLEQFRGQIWGLNRLGEDLLVNSHNGTFQLKNRKLYPISSARGTWKMMPLQGFPDLAIEGGYSGLYLHKRVNSGQDLPNWQFLYKIEGFDESARVMEQDELGNIWVSHAYKGLFLIKLTDDNRRAEVRYFGAEDGLPSNISINVLKIQGEVLFTTLEGVYRFDHETDRFVSHEAFNQMLNGPQQIQRLIQDEKGKLWFSMGQNFGYFSIQEQGFLEQLTVDQYYFNHLQEALVDGFEKVCAIDDENTIIATEKGFVMYSPKANTERDLSLNVLLREVRTIAHSDSVLYVEGLMRAKNSAETVQELPSQLNSLRFSYSAPFYEQPDELQYRYWLKGYNEDWSDWNTRTDKEFTNLVSGEYEFLVQARNAYGTISEPIGYTFKILPPWYASSLAKSVYLFVGLLGLVAIFVSISRQMEKERLALSEQQAQALARKEAEFREEKEKSDVEIDRLRNEKLQSDVQHRTSQLASATMHLVQKGEVLLKIKKELSKVVKSTAVEENRKKLQKIIHTIDGNIRLDSNWEQFEAYFDQVHENFLRNLREAYPDLTPKDQKLCAYLRMNLTTKEIAPLMNISVRGVEISRYRLRKKLDLDTNTNLTDFIMRF